jgi:Peptidase family M28
MTNLRRTFATAAAVMLVPVLLAAQQAQQVQPVIVPQPATALPLKHAPQPTTAAITAADLMTRLYVFADDSMNGREAGELGNFKGTTYIAGELARMGLVPAGDGGTYFQTIPLKQRVTDAASTLTVGGAPLAFGSEWASMSTVSVSKPGLATVFGGTTGDSARMIAPAAASGKLVVFVLGPNTAVVRRMANASGGPAVIAVIAPAMYLAYFSRPTQFVDDAGDQPPAAGAPVVFVSAAAAAKFFDKPVADLEPGAAGTPAALDVKVDVTPVAAQARNVVGIIPGSDPALKGEYVAVGAHNDHIGFTHEPVDHDSLRIFNHTVRPLGADSRADPPTAAQMTEVKTELAAWRAAHPGATRLDSIDNGADDDGSGTVTALEVAQKMMSLDPHPKRSMLFVWHVGEEKGLLGSIYFTDHPTVPRDSIVAQLNMDMVGRGDAWDMTGTSKDGAFLRGAPNYLMLVGSRRLSTELGNLVEQVNIDDHHGFTFDYAMDADGHPENVYCRSDHYEYARYGIPITFFTTGLHSDYHQVTDEPEYIDYEHMARVGNLVEDVALHVANLDHRVAVDHARPDPHGACRQ